MEVQKRDRARISLIVSLVISLALLGWWIVANIAMLSAIILHYHNIINQARPRLTSKVFIPTASYKPIHYLFFNGSGSYGVIPANQNLNVHQFSIAFWARSDGPNHSSFDRPVEMLQWIKNSTGVPIPYGWAFDVGDQSRAGIDKIFFRVGNTHGNLYGVGPVRLFPNSWTHLVGTFDGISLKIYENGVLVGAYPFQGSYAYHTPPLPIQLAIGWLPQHYWTGDLSDIRVYGRPLSQIEISSIFNGNNETHGLIGHWPLNEGSGIRIHDSSENNNNGVIQNGLWR
jgi:Concanavalin A-like lectin/glucanases superfamily